MKPVKSALCNSLAARTKRERVIRGSSKSCVTDGALGHSIIVGATNKPLGTDQLCTDGESHEQEAPLAGTEQRVRRAVKCSEIRPRCTKHRTRSFDKFWPLNSVL